MNREILLAQPRGFCAGVCRAIQIVESALAKFGAPIYIRHEIVHNKHVVENLRKKGAIFIEELNDVPDGSTLIFSAHGVPKSVREQAEKRGLTVFDATCPLVTKVHAEVIKMHKDGHQIIIIGHKGHPEVEGTMGQIESGITLIQNAEEIENLNIENPDKLAYVTQTTLSLEDSAEIIEALKKRFPNILEPKKSDICFATTNRQEAVKIMAKQVDMVLVVGSRNSSNSNRLREVAEKNGAFARMVDNATEIEEEWLKDKKRIGITAGASAPEILVNEVINFLKERGVSEIKVLDGITENTSFPLPKGLI